MKTTMQLEELGLAELTKIESVEVTGGDTFSYNFGIAVGVVAGWLTDVYTAYSDYNNKVSQYQ